MRIPHKCLWLRLFLKLTAAFQKSKNKFFSRWQQKWMHKFCWILMSNFKSDKPCRGASTTRFPHSACMEILAFSLTDSDFCWEQTQALQGLVCLDVIYFVLMLLCYTLQLRGEKQFLTGLAIMLSCPQEFYLVHVPTLVDNRILNPVESKPGHFPAQCHWGLTHCFQQYSGPGCHLW